MIDTILVMTAVLSAVTGMLLVIWAIRDKQVHGRSEGLLLVCIAWLILILIGVR